MKVGRGATPYSPLSLLSLWLHLCVWSNPKPATNVRQACSPLSAFKVIQGHPYWCRQESRTVCCRNVQLMPMLFLKLTKIWQRENGKFVDFNCQRLHSSLKTSSKSVRVNGRRSIRPTTFGTLFFTFFPLPLWRSRRRGCRGHIPSNILVGGGTSVGISPPILLRTFGYSRPILVVLAQ